MQNTVHMFESDVIPDSGKTTVNLCDNTEEFESDVIPDSGKTKPENKEYIKKV